MPAPGAKDKDHCLHREFSWGCLLSATRPCIGTTVPFILPAIVMVKDYEQEGKRAVEPRWSPRRPRGHAWIPWQLGQISLDDSVDELGMPLHTASGPGSDSPAPVPSMPLTTETRGVQATHIEAEVQLTVPGSWLVASAGSGRAALHLDLLEIRLNDAPSGFLI